MGGIALWPPEHGRVSDDSSTRRIRQSSTTTTPRGAVGVVDSGSSDGGFRSGPVGRTGAHSKAGERSLCCLLVPRGMVWQQINPKSLEQNIYGVLISDLGGKVNEDSSISCGGNIDFITLYGINEMKKFSIFLFYFFKCLKR